MIAEPVIIVELMSPSGEAAEAGPEWFGYCKSLSLRPCLVPSQDERDVQLHRRSGDLWRERFASPGATELDDPPLRLEIDPISAGTGIAA